MIEIVVVEGEVYRKRSPLAVWLLLPFITLGIYTFVWYYKVNDEARRYLRDDSINPLVSLLAVTIGFVLILPPFVSIYRTCWRIRRMEEKAGANGRIDPVLGLLLNFVFKLDWFYMQAHLNRVWDAHQRSVEPGPALSASA